MRKDSGIARNLCEIGQALGTLHLLEGSVQPSGGRYESTSTQTKPNPPQRLSDAFFATPRTFVRRNQ